MLKIEAECNGEKIDAELYENEEERRDMEWVNSPNYEYFNVARAVLFGNRKTWNHI